MTHATTLKPLLILQIKLRCLDDKKFKQYLQV